MLRQRPYASVRQAALMCAALLSSSACAPADQDLAEPVAEQTPSPDAKPSGVADAAQALTSATGPNWLAVGGAYVDLVGEDGEPDEPAGRFVNGGEGVEATAHNVNGWLVAGPRGLTSFLDEDGKPQRGDLRMALMGQTARVLSMGEQLDAGGQPQEVFLIGGDQGRAQLMDAFGEPAQIERQLFGNGAQVSAAAFHPGSRQWLVGAADGQLQAVGADLTPSAAAAPFSEAIRAIVGNPVEQTQRRWLMVSGEQFSYYPNPTPTVLEAGLTLSALGRHEGRVAVGGADGRVAIFDFEAVAAGAARWVDALEGRAALGFAHSGERWLVYGQGGAARLLDAQGQPVGPLALLGDGADLTGARWVKGRWLITTRSSYVLDLKPDLTLNAQTRSPLEGARVLGAEVSQEAALVVGEQGRYRRLDSRGEASGPLQTLAGQPSLRAASWSRSSYLIGGQGGVAQVLDAQGQPQGSPLTLLDGQDIHTIAWSGAFWLVAGQQGKTQRVRSDGTLVDATPRTLEGFDTIHAARWSGREWMLVGVKSGQAAFQLIQQDGTPKTQAQRLASIPGPLYAVEWNGREWFMGGHAGALQVASAEGTPREQPGPMPRILLSGADILAMDYYKGNLLVGGRRGLVQKISDALTSPRAPVSILSFEDVVAARWTKPRGFGGGECLTPDLCYNGRCIGGSVQEGFCCDQTCDAPCQSCLQEETGQANGVCSPILKGRRPQQPSGCTQSAEATCGQTGLCDGAGACELYGTEVMCRAASCAAGQVQPDSFCDGAGTCAGLQAVSCDPYVICQGSACATSCASTNDCVQGFRCANSVCEPIPEAPAPEPKAEDTGCCATIATGPPSAGRAGWLGLGLLGLMAWRRRRALGQTGSWR